MKWITMLLLSNVLGKLGYWAARKWHRFHKTVGSSWGETIHRRKQAKTQETTTAARRTPR